MSTRANVIVKKGDRNLIFYRHCDGYPEGLGEDLKQCIVSDPTFTLFNIIEDCDLELTDFIHGDIEYLYTLDLNHLTLDYEKLTPFSKISNEDIAKILRLAGEWNTRNLNQVDLFKYIKDNFK